MTASLAAIRQFLVDYYDDEDLTRLCFDHFHEVYQGFTVNTSKGRKALLLVDYCQRRDRLPALLRVLKKERPDAFGRILGGGGRSRDRRVDINRASEDELRYLPGIGPKLARAIIGGRPFASVDELRRVAGIGERRFDGIRDWCAV